MSVVSYIQKTQSARGFAETVYSVHSSRSYSYIECFSHLLSHKFPFRVSENYTSPTLSPQTLVFAAFSLCRVLLQCSANNTRLTVRA